MSIRKAVYEHLKTKKKYNTLKLNYDEMTRLKEERTRERDVQIDINKIMKKSFDEETKKLIEEIINLKKENKELKNKIRNKKKEEE